MKGSYEQVFLTTITNSRGGGVAATLGQTRISLKLTGWSFIIERVKNLREEGILRNFWLCARANKHASYILMLSQKMLFLVIRVIPYQPKTNPDPRPEWVHRPFVSFILSQYYWHWQAQDKHRKGHEWDLLMRFAVICSGIFLAVNKTKQNKTK